MPLAEPPPRDGRFGSPLQLSTMHWVRPELVAEVTYLTWTEDNLLRQVSYQGQREDKPPAQVIRCRIRFTKSAESGAANRLLGNAEPVATLDVDARAETLEVFGLWRRSSRPTDGKLLSPTGPPMKLSHDAD